VEAKSVKDGQQWNELSGGVANFVEDIEESRKQVSLKAVAEQRKRSFDFDMLSLRSGKVSLGHFQIFPFTFLRSRFRSYLFNFTVVDSSFTTTPAF
jgi:hypothetical protein